MGVAGILHVGPELVHPSSPLKRMPQNPDVLWFSVGFPMFMDHSVYSILHTIYYIPYTVYLVLGAPKRAFFFHARTSAQMILGRRFGRSVQLQRGPKDHVNMRIPIGYIVYDIGYMVYGICDQTEGSYGTCFLESPLSWALEPGCRTPLFLWSLGNHSGYVKQADRFQAAVLQAPQSHSNIMVPCS